MNRRPAESGREPDASKRTPRRAGRIDAGWSLAAHARDRVGEEVSIANDEASAWMLCAAFALAGKDGIPMNHLPRALGVVTGMNSIEGWNDDPRRTFGLVGRSGPGGDSRRVGGPAYPA
jgi:hypothetical protein